MSETRPHEHLVVTVPEDGVEILRIDREEALGALNFGIVTALGDYFRDLAKRKDEVRVLVLTGTGRAFVAGGDISGYHGAGQTVFDDFQRRSKVAFDALAALPQVTICAANGYALGGGFELAMCCDFIFASEKAKRGLPEIKLGLLPGGGGTQRLPRLVGPMRAKELILSGRMITAAEAVQYGAVLDAFAPDELMTRVLEFARDLAAQAPVALREGKRIVDDGLDTALSAGLTFEQRVLGGLFATEDGKEGVAAFLEKRPPAFTGR